MKTLFIVRHGKSSWNLNSINDIDRPLKERGISDGYIMAETLLKRQLKPEIILSSNAIRALHSATIFHRVLELSPTALTIDPSLYLAGVDEILSTIYGADDSLGSLMIFGHNPGFTEIANYLSNMKILNVPTTGVVILKFNAKKWNIIGRDVLVNESFDFPGKN